MQLAFGYVRRSSYKQQENNSFEIQKSRIQDYAKKNKLTIPEEFIFVEDVTSAFAKRASQRKALMQLRDRMIETNINYVVFNEESRMDRTGYTFVLDFYRPLLDYFGEVNIYTTQTDSVWDPNSMEAKIVLLLYRQESEIKSERSIGVLKNFLHDSEGKRPGSKIPYGYAQVNQKLVPNEKAEVVSFIFFLHSWGISMQRIAFILNEAIIPSPQQGIWRSSSIETILKNTVYTGNLEWNIRKGNEQTSYAFTESHLPIVQSELVHLIELNTRLQHEYGRLDTPFLLLNKVDCRECRTALSAKNSSALRNGKKYEYRYYVCTICNYKIPIDDIHERVIPKLEQYLQQLLTEEEQKQGMLEILEQRIQLFESDITGVEQDLTVLLSKVTDAQVHGDNEFLTLLHRKKETLIEKRSTLQHHLQMTTELHDTVQSGPFLQRFMYITKHLLSNNEIRLIILYFIDKIIVSSKKEPNILFHEGMFTDLFIDG